MTGLMKRVWILVLLVLSLAVILSACMPVPALADSIPHQAKAYQRTLVRSANAYWGLDAPVATIAAQVHQESRWRADAISPAGAEGLAQFMPGTSDWFAELYPDDLGTRQPFNPGWSLRAVVLYDRWLHRRIQASSECERWAFILASYNGGLGWVLKDKRLASASGADSLAWFNSVEKFNAGRSRPAFAENRKYPRLILRRWEPLYMNAGWGDGVCHH
jgi:soluble lytic murein transglycosylase-like protein